MATKGLIPWNVHGVLLAALLGMSTADWGPFAFVCFLTPVVSFVMALVAFRTGSLPEEQDVVAVYGEELAGVPNRAQLA